MKKALILNISYLEEDMILALKKMGYFVVATGNNDRLRGKAYVDKYIQADFSDKEKILELAKNEGIEAVVSCGNDFGVLTAAYVAEKLGLQGHDTLSNATILHHKDSFKQFAKENGILTPIAERFSDEKSALQYLQSCHQFPLIVKPIDLSAGNGITKINNQEEGKLAIKTAFDKSREKMIIIEPFVDGTLNACCTFLINKKVAVVCSNNEFCNINPYRVDMALYPSDNFDVVKDILIEQVEMMAALLNLEDGIFSIQYIYKDRKVNILEGMRRVLGNFYMKTASLANNFDWDYWQAYVQTGNGSQNIGVEHTEQKGFFAYRAIMAKENGIISCISIPSNLREHIVFEYDLRNIGDEIHDYKSEPLKFLVLRFSCRSEMEELMINQYDCINVSIK